MCLDGIMQAESPECTPANSICSITAGTKACVPSGVRILGTPPSVIDLAEDRDQFRAMMDKLEIPMPESGMAITVEEALAIAAIWATT